MLHCNLQMPLSASHTQKAQTTSANCNEHVNSRLGIEHDPVTIKAAKRASVAGGLAAVGAGMVGSAPSTIPLAAVGPYAYFMQVGALAGKL